MNLSSFKYLAFKMAVLFIKITTACIRIVYTLLPLCQLNTYFTMTFRIVPSFILMMLSPFTGFSSWIPLGEK